MGLVVRKTVNGIFRPVSLGVGSGLAGHGRTGLFADFSRRALIKQFSQGRQGAAVAEQGFAVFQIEGVIESVRVFALCMLENGFRLVQRLDEVRFVAKFVMRTATSFSIRALAIQAAR